MPRLNRPLLAIALFAFASFARAGSLRLVAPAAGVTLRGGSFAELRWSAAQVPPSAEEWEAFLSIDGGKYYAFRVTPHLDIDRRRFTFVVPNVDTSAARILIRTGNEVQEMHFEARGTFSIVRDAKAEIGVPNLLQFGRGEAARDGDPAVLSWADGSRNGSGIRQQTSAPVRPGSLHQLTNVGNDAPPGLAPAVNWIATPSTSRARRVARVAQLRDDEHAPISVDLLLVCRRRNI
jgi:hypothetical protein